MRFFQLLSTIAFLKNTVTFPPCNGLYGFNASIVRLMNQMNCYIEEKDKEIAELKKEIEELKGGK